MTCDLCQRPEDELLYEDDKLYIILVNDPNYPGFCRLIWKAHVKEMTDLTKPDQQYLWETLMKIETAIRQILNPDKINLASLGNVVPHLHWHIIPRFTTDMHYPSSIWAEPRRTSSPIEIKGLKAKLQAALN